MTHILLVAHETATSRRLLDRVEQLRTRDPELRLSLLIPETPVNRMMVWEATETRAAAQAALREAHRMFVAAGIDVASRDVGDADPVLAIEDSIRTSGEPYDAVLLSTLPPGRSRWLRIDTPRRARRSVDIPVLLAIPGDDQAWRTRSRPWRSTSAAAGGWGRLRSVRPGGSSPSPASGSSCC